MVRPRNGGEGFHVKESLDDEWLREVGLRGTVPWPLNILASKTRRSAWSGLPFLGRGADGVCHGGSGGPVMNVTVSCMARSFEEGLRRVFDHPPRESLPVLSLRVEMSYGLPSLGGSAAVTGALLSPVHNDDKPGLRDGGLCGIRSEEGWWTIVSVKEEMVGDAVMDATVSMNGGGPRRVGGMGFVHPLVTLWEDACRAPARAPDQSPRPKNWGGGQARRLGLTSGGFSETLGEDWPGVIPCFPYSEIPTNQTVARSRRPEPKGHVLFIIGAGRPRTAVSPVRLGNIFESREPSSVARRPHPPASRARAFRRGDRVPTLPEPSFHGGTTPEFRRPGGRPTISSGNRGTWVHHREPYGFPTEMTIHTTYEDAANAVLS